MELTPTGTFGAHETLEATFAVTVSTGSVLRSAVPIALRSEKNRRRGDLDLAGQSDISLAELCRNGEVRPRGLDADALVEVSALRSSAESHGFEDFFQEKGGVLDCSGRDDCFKGYIVV